MNELDLRAISIPDPEDDFKALSKNVSDFVLVKVKLTNEDGETMSKAFPCYNEIRLAQDCPNLKDLVDQTAALFKGVIERVQITAKYEWK